VAKHLKSLPISDLRRFCDPKSLKFKSTAELPALEHIIGQDRALNAITFGLEIKSHGYNLYALGPVGTGKATIVRKFLEKDAKNQPVPDDWLYVNNFDDTDKPHAINLPVGKGRQFKDDLDRLVEELQSEVPKAFEGKEYERAQQSIEEEFQKRSKELFQKLDKKAARRGFRLMQTPQGIAAFPIVDNKVITPDQQEQLDDKKLEEIEKNREILVSGMRDTLKRIEELQKEGKERVHELDQRVVGFSINHLINDLKDKYASYKCVLNYLSEAQKHLLKNVAAFKQLKQMQQMSQQQKTSMSLLMGPGTEEPTFDEYRANLIVDNSKTEGAPVVFEKNPTGPNLIGRIERQGYFGTLVTNFRMIKAGSLHRAIGGYLIIEVLDLLTKPFAWHIIKRALKNREIVIESMEEAIGALITRTLEPAPIPLDTKVILIGDPYLYHLLFNLDQEFKDLFKVKADFASQVDWDNEIPNHYAQFIGTICNEEKLMHFAPSGVAKVVEYGSRLVENQKKIATKFGDIVDIVRQSSYWAKKNGNKYVQDSDVKKALDEKIYRSNRIEKRLQEMIEEGTIFIDTEGKVVGQINGLSVLQMGDYSFGKPSRITARTFVGSGGVVSIDREVDLGGPIHNKGAMIITGYLGGKYATHNPLIFSASLTFEQLYDDVEGDSASSAEIYALLSSLSNLPLKQDIAVTGSVNQRGEIQPIGGANEKIEGFFELCKVRGFTGKQGVMIPASNVKHLMLKEEVIDAVKADQFHIYAVSTIDEGIEILTGVSAGTCTGQKGYPKNTVNYAVQNRIIELAKTASEFSSSKRTTCASRKKHKKSKK